MKKKAQHRATIGLRPKKNKYSYEHELVTSHPPVRRAYFSHLGDAVCGKINHFALRLSPEFSLNAAPATKSDTLLYSTLFYSSLLLFGNGLYASLLYSTLLYSTPLYSTLLFSLLYSAFFKTPVTRKFLNLNFQGDESSKKMHIHVPWVPCHIMSTTSLGQALETHPSLPIPHRPWRQAHQPHEG